MKPIYKRISADHVHYFQIKKNRKGLWVGRSHFRFTHNDHKPAYQILPIGVDFR